MQQKPDPASQTLTEAEAAGNTIDVIEEQWLLSESAGGDSVPEIALPDIPLPDSLLSDIPLPDGSLPGAPGLVDRPGVNQSSRWTGGLRSL
jgi:hypothetical protein